MSERLTAAHLTSLIKWIEELRDRGLSLPDVIGQIYEWRAEESGNMEGPIRLGAKACPECACGKHGESHELWCKYSPKTMTMGELREMLTKAIELDGISETKRVGLLAHREHWNGGGQEQYLKPVMFVGVHFIRGEYVFTLAENGLQE